MDGEKIDHWLFDEKSLSDRRSIFSPPPPNQSWVSEWEEGGGRGEKGKKDEEGKEKREEVQVFDTDDEDENEYESASEDE